MVQNMSYQLGEEGGGNEVIQLESLCMNCGDNGTTRMLFMDIPHWRQVVVMAFECPHCNFQNNELKPAAAVAEKGLKIILTVDSSTEPEVLSRQIVKSENACISIPEVELEIPGSKGQLTTVEGIISNTISDLQMGQADRRRAGDLQSANAIDDYCQKLANLKTQVFTVILDDPSGNSYISSKVDPAQDSQMKLTYYERTKEQIQEIGLSVGAQNTEIQPSDPHHGHNPIGAVGARIAIANAQGQEATNLLTKYSTPEEVMILPGSCYTCGADCDTRMFQTSIPFFKDIIVMSNACDVCGYRNSEVKSNTGISEKGSILRLSVVDANDLRRDLIKSDTAEIEIPEIELDMSTGLMGGLVTTVEGLLTQIKEQLKKLSGFHLGDSAEEGQKQRWLEVVQNLENYANLEQQWTLVIKDPLSNSFIAPSLDDPKLDDRLVIQQYERSKDEEDQLGITELKKMEENTMQEQ
eukprot:TRINITY_DN1557_c0_g1_i7.p1 TRINITY_DN1557_c0_g1~~TRINITY_DN1557_c0_g1_i7.p1  ORF type:complete len:467 (+),score=71.49 TRINITY_DN1557_c0_g1_i7:113-1513(+)